MEVNRTIKVVETPVITITLTEKEAKELSKWLYSSACTDLTRRIWGELSKEGLN